MLFNSYIFILLFLPVALFLYFGLNHIGKETEAKISLVIMSLWFYGYFHVSYLLLLVGSILFNFVCSRMLLRSGRGINHRRLLLGIGITANIGVIFYFKYYNFFLENVNGLFRTDIPLKEILMPLGISFFTFQQISYLVDSYREETGEYTFVDYALFVTFFPQLIAGPIVLHQEMIPQFNDKARKKLGSEKFARGLWLFSVGLFKKVMIADILGKGADWGFANPEILTGADALVVSLLYTLQIYFDFSGYCDMASGIASMFQMEMPVNFNSPYKATSILDFWQRWHMSLTRFLRKYIYFPLGGSRKGTARTMLNVMIVFGVSGIWHGASWTFILWGLIHGAAQVLNRLFKNAWERIPGILRWLATFFFVNFTWILFRAESLTDAGMIFSRIFNFGEMRLSSELLEQFAVLEFTYIVEHIAVLNGFVANHPAIYLLIFLTGAMLLALIPQNCQQKKFVPGVKNALGSIVMLVWSVVSLSGLATFLYFNF